MSKIKEERKSDIVKKVRNALTGEGPGVIVWKEGRTWKSKVCYNCSPTEALDREAKDAVFFRHECNPPISLREAKQELEAAYYNRPPEVFK